MINKICSFSTTVSLLISLLSRILALFRLFDGRLSPIHGIREVNRDDSSIVGRGVSDSRFAIACMQLHWYMALPILLGVINVSAGSVTACREMNRVMLRALSPSRIWSGPLLFMTQIHPSLRSVVSLIRNL